MDDLRLERILRAVEGIPEGQVATYGTIGKIVGESPRVVGNVMARWGSNVPWWRVVNARGEIPGHHQRVREHWEREGLLRPAHETGQEAPSDGTLRVRLSNVAADVVILTANFERAVEDLPSDAASDSDS
ncbi:MGMT family protein [Kocuria massiliensis]|uniref:MGMT family protein n=1 Tax=Kocuria massiliensis TaxID=1926282 RepID=UPI001FE2C5B4|nr:MGMT family protein [Kocuria massiliensis]